MNFIIKENAFKRVAHLLEQEKGEKKNIALRVSVNGGGCSGFMYQYDFVDHIKDDDLILESNNVKVIIDPISQPFLKNCTLNFIEELGNSYFEIINPQASSRCGCGNSFSL